MSLPEHSSLERKQIGRLRLAGKNGDIAKLNEALDMGADINLSDGIGTAVMYAAAGGHLEFLKYAVAKGADLSLIGGEDKYALDYANEFGHHLVAKYIMEQLGTTAHLSPRSSDSIERVRPP